MRKALIQITSAATLALAGTASAAIDGSSRAVSPGSHGTHLVQARHRFGADTNGNTPWNALAETARTDACITPEPSKLGLLRSTLGTGSKTRTLCRKLKA